MRRNFKSSFEKSEKFFAFFKSGIFYSKNNWNMQQKPWEIPMTIFPGLLEVAEIKTKERPDINGPPVLRRVRINIYV